MLDFLTGLLKYNWHTNPPDHYDIYLPLPAGIAIIKKKIVVKNVDKLRPWCISSGK